MVFGQRYMASHSAFQSLCRQFPSQLGQPLDNLYVQEFTSMRQLDELVIVEFARSEKDHDRTLNLRAISQSRYGEFRY